jgi:hypothetical protein
MKYSKYIFLLIGSLAFTSCQKNEVASPAYDAASQIPFWSGRYSIQKNNDVKFLFDGTADFITFYSGETGKEYQYKDRTALPNGSATTPDKGTAIKGFSDNSLTEFTYKYVAAGTYTATFVATNRSAYGPAKTVVISIPVVVTP